MTPAATVDIAKIEHVLVTITALHLTTFEIDQQGQPLTPATMDSDYVIDFLDYYVGSVVDYDRANLPAVEAFQQVILNHESHDPAMRDAFLAKVRQCAALICTP